MTWKLQNVFTFFFGCCIFTFLAVHFAHMKTPSQSREIASNGKIVHPWYDASWKF